MTELAESIEKLTKDLREAARLMTRDEARFLVDAYYITQEDRKRFDNQVLALSKSQEPSAVILWLGEQSRRLEKQIAGALDRYSANQRSGIWARAQDGIGPVIAAGLLAHVNMEYCTTAGKLWHFAGLDPTSKWEKGQKRPWNASLKTLCWKIGESFVKVSGKEDAFYGKLYMKRKAFEIENNESGKLKEQAENALKTKNYDKSTDAYKSYITGKLPPAHIHARAKRWTVKLFLSHYWEISYLEHYKEKAPSVYAIGILNHVDYIAPPPG